MQLFNPWNDLALAANDPRYTPPASALQLAADLSGLSRLWDAYALLPWGWSPLQVRLMLEAGVSEALLPTKEQMAVYRAFVSRQTAVRLLAQLQASWPEAWHQGWLVGESRWCETEEHVLAAQATYGRVMLKAPWSGSGRGVHPTALQLTEKDRAWIRRTLQRQGGVEVEPIYNKVLDFAMEFWAEKGQVRFEGLSLFTTTEGGVYSGNLVASEEEKERRLSRYIPLECLRELRERLTALLNSAGVPSWYAGPFGIDMMVVKNSTRQSGSLKTSDVLDVPSENGLALHPFVELNFRMTMGWLALLLSRQQPSEDCRLFRIVHEAGHYRYELKRLIG